MRRLLEYIDTHKEDFNRISAVLMMAVSFVGLTIMM